VQSGGQWSSEYRPGLQTERFSPYFPGYLYSETINPALENSDTRNRLTRGLIAGFYPVIKFFPESFVRQRGLVRRIPHFDKVTSQDLGVSCNWFIWDLSSVDTATFGILEGQHSQFAYYIPPSLMVSRATQGYRNRAVASGEGTC
jgi:hypothetical protein